MPVVFFFLFLVRLIEPSLPDKRAAGIDLRSSRKFPKTFFLFGPDGTRPPLYFGTLVFPSFFFCSERGRAHHVASYEENGPPLFFLCVSLRCHGGLFRDNGAARKMGEAYGRTRPLLGRLFESHERDRSSSDSAAGFAPSIAARNPVPAVTTSSAPEKNFSAVNHFCVCAWLTRSSRRCHAH